MSMLNVDNNSLTESLLSDEKNIEYEFSTDDSNPPKVISHKKTSDVITQTQKRNSKQCFSFGKMIDDLFNKITNSN